MSFEFLIALRYLVSRRHSTPFLRVVALFSVGGVFLGVAALIVALSMMNGFEEEIRSRIVGTTAHITIYTFDKRGLTDWQSLVKRVEKMEHIVAAAPFVYTKSAISSRSGNDGIMVRGVVPSIEKNVTSTLDHIRTGEVWSVPHNGLAPIVLGSSLASELEAIPGDTVVLFALKNRAGAMTSITPKVRRFVVSGIFETGLYDFDAGLAYIPMDAARSFFEMGNAVSGLELRTDKFDKADEIAKKIENKLGFPYYAVSWGEMNKSLYSWMTLEKWGLFLALMLIIAVAAFNIAGTLIMIVLERTTDIGILRAIGTSQGSIRRIFIIQGFLVGILGTILGLAFGLGLCYLQMHYRIIALPPDIYTISALPIQVHLWDVVVVSLAAVIISLLSSLYPAIYGSKLSPIDAIRYG